MSHELYKKYRPKDLKQLVGQNDLVTALSEKISERQLSHAIMFTGPSGTGKTTVARILVKHVGCIDNKGHGDFHEVNAANYRGIDMVRDIDRAMRKAPLPGGKAKVWLIDECHALSKDAQGALLKMLEDTPEDVYFMLATTEPGKLLNTIKTRCYQVALKALQPKSMRELLESVVKAEGKEVTEDIYDKIIECSEGSARKALVYLDQVIDLDEDTALNVIVPQDAKRQGIEIARLLLNPRTQWGDVAKVLKEIGDEPETVRRIVLGYANTVLLGGGKLSGRCSLILSAFRDHYYDCGMAGLTLSCWEVVQQK